MRDHHAPYYRRRAEQCRSFADLATDSLQRDRWLEVALAFEELAESAEDLERLKQDWPEQRNG